MRTEDDLRSTFDRLAENAPPTDDILAALETDQPRTARRALVPLAAVAAVSAVVAGLAFGVPALRGDNAQPPVSGTDAGPAKPAIEPLTEAEKSAYVTVCRAGGFANPDPAARIYTVTEAFKWVKPPSGTHALAWVVLAYKSGRQDACGFNAKGQRSEYAWATSGETKMAAIDKTAAGGGTYTKSITRVTIAFGDGPATEAILRNGFFFAPMPYKDTMVRPKPDSAPTYTVRAYDADGQLVYASAKTFREQQAQLDDCYTNPEGTKVIMVFGGRQGTPPVSECKRGVAWNW
jgi:hypothetical protein